MQIILILNLIILNLSNNLLGVVARTTTDRIQGFGYSSRTYNVVTDDGYILAIFRMKNSTTPDSTDGAPRPVVLFMHGLTSSSDGWVIPRPELALAYILADNGYDVWLGNARGTPYGTRHKFKTLQDPTFWRFSWHEIGVIDLPNTIDYILKETGQTSLHYVGHSQGTAIMFVLLSMRPEYNKKLITGHMLAPIAYMKYARSPLIELLSPFLGTYSPLDPLVGDLPLMQQPILRNLLSLDRCQDPRADYDICAFILFTIYGGYSGYFNKTMLPEIFETHPASCSTHQGIHLAQLHVSGRFCQYDYGVEGNRQRYNRDTPPDYEVENINPRFPLHFYYSDYDTLSSKTDSENFSRVLGNKSVNHFVSLKRFAHLDFILALNVNQVINLDLLKRMNEAEMLLRQDETNAIK